jgi:hypothetical protein
MLLSPRHSIMLLCLIFSTIINASPIPKPSGRSYIDLHSRSIFDNTINTADIHASVFTRRSFSDGTKTTVITVVMVIGFFLAVAFAAWITFGAIHDIIWDPRKPTPVNMAKNWRAHARGKIVYHDHRGDLRLQNYNGDPRSIGPGMYVAGDVGPEQDMRAVWLIQYPIDNSTSNAGGGG